jgi:protein-ribulosamine 3-kinase
MMSDQGHQLHKEMPSYLLFLDNFRIPLEKMVSEYYGMEWRVKNFKDMRQYSSHPSAILTGDTRSVFVKLSEAAHGFIQFEVELNGLRMLSDRASVMTPAPVGVIQVNEGALLVLEAVHAVERTAERWRDMGRTLAKIHQVKGTVCGYERQGYFGPLYQDNRPLEDWLTFYTERRLWPRLMGAIDAGRLPPDSIRQIERFITRLPALHIPQAEPVLLHGDAQQNNFISTAQGTLAIDPALYYGHPEMDLAYVDFFEAVPGEVFEGYQELLAIEPGFKDRRELWRVPAYLAVVMVEGASYLGRLMNAVQKYL